MRLSREDANIIKVSIIKYISDAQIYLFGSRVYDNKKGGDIDIFVKTEKIISLREKLKILVDIEFSGISRKVDLIVQMPNSNDKGIFQTAQDEGILL